MPLDLPRPVRLAALGWPTPGRPSQHLLIRHVDHLRVDGMPITRRRAGSNVPILSSE